MDKFGSHKTQGLGLRAWVKGLSFRVYGNLVILGGES